jgi:diguanylate cyclase (GGDEF)-like protein/PAS domain S-box-containing protein
VLAEILPSPVFRFDKDCRRIYVNPAAEKIAGIAAAELLYRKASDVSPLNAEEMMKVEHTIEKVLKTGEPQEVEVLFRVPATQQIYYFYTNYVPEFDANGNVAGVIAISHDITERKRMEDELAVREREFRTLAENVPGILIRYDEKCRMRYLNQKLIEGCPQDTGLKIGQTLVQAYPNDPLFEELHEIIRKVIETGQPSETERYFPNHQGGGTWVFRHVAETDDSGNIIGALALGQDISERKRMENELAAREHEFRTLAENIPDNLLRYDLQCQLHYMNLATMLNLAPEAVPTIGNTPSQSFPNNSVAVDIHNAIKHAIETGEACDMEIPWLNANAGIGVHHLRCVAERDSKGNITGALMLGRDISERKKMEDALAAREREFRILVETSPAPIFRYDTNCRRIYVNPVVEQMTGKTAAELLNRVPSDASVLRQSEGEKLESVLRQVIQTGQAAEGEIECVIANGETRHYYNRYAPELDADGQVISVILVALDITERKHAEQLLLQREQEFRSLAENMPDNLIRYDLQARVRYLNPAITRSLAPEVLPKLNKTLVESFPDNEKVIAAQLIIERVIATGATIDTEFCVPNPEGEMRTHHLRYVAEYDNKGNIIGVLVIGRDLTERKQMEMAVQQHEQEFRTLVDNLPTTVLRYNHHCQRIYANPAYLQIMGGSEAELLNKPLEETWVATNLSVEAYKAILHEVMRDGEKKEVILEWTDRNDKLVCHVLKIVPEYAIDGQIQSALVLGFDLSEQRKQQLIEASRQQVFEKTARNNSLDTILEQVALYVESSKSGRYCAILLVDEAKNQLQLVAAPSFPESYFAKSNTVTLDIKSKHCLGWVASALCEKRVIMENIHAYPCDSLCQKFIREIGAVACWSEPIMSSSNQLLGVVTLYLNQAAQPDENDLALLLQASHLSAIAIERKRIEQQMFYQASYDILTSLPNRWLFHDRLQEEISKADAKGHQLALLFIDLDHFKEVNDTLGHKIGDNLLVHAAHRIQNCVRQSDIVARLGGDEFVVILPELGTVLFVERTAEAIIQAMTQPFKLGEYQTYISASVGIAMYPQDAVQAETLVSYADQAMYAAKQAGRNSFNFFTRSMQEQAQQRLYLVNSLRDALEKNQFEVYYQPIIEVASGKAVKAEALLRWHHPVLGMVSPVVFIPLAEETDLIHSIGSWVFCQAADMAKHWNALSGENEPRKVSINMSPRQLIKGHGDQIAIAYLQAIALDSTHIVVEITEGLLLDDSPDITEKMERLRNGGIQLSLDDFGTGYSAMAYLKKFDINYLKIDRSFVRELETNADDRAITEAIVVMAHRLGLKVIAEGVETEGQRALLAAVGCEYIQGYFYAKPMPIETFWSYVLE